MRFLIGLFFLFTFFSSSAQLPEGLAYYLPADAMYNNEIPSPSEFLGYDIGFGRHASHDELIAYMSLLAQASDRIEIQYYGKSHEGRRLACLLISSPENLENKTAIMQQRQQMIQPGQAADSGLPGVVYMGYSIHGNETSGSNAAFLFAWYLAACESEALQNQLKHTVVLLDPCFNPDGMQRFSSWINSHKSMSTVSDPAADEYHEPWPGGRTNHYWFDLNRDWLVAQQPESPGRVEIFQNWLPNVLTDHHEMGTNSTFFFQPGVPSRVNPITPLENQELTAKIGTYHARYFSEKNILFYSGENYDDFYYGKGSSYPDANGSIGILFEQASSRGTVQDSKNGPLHFAYTVRNQVISSFSTLDAVSSMRTELNEYTRSFYHNAIKEAEKDPVQAYVFEAAADNQAAREFIQILLRNRVEVHRIKSSQTLQGHNYDKTEAFAVPTRQIRYKLVRTIFERPTAFPDSVFYDISAWTLPDAFGLNWSPANARISLGERLKSAPGLQVKSQVKPGDSAPYAYLIPPEPYLLPKFIYQLQQIGTRLDVATKPFTSEGRDFPAGTVILPMDRQPADRDAMQRILRAAPEMGVSVYPTSTGQTSKGPDLGSNNMLNLRMPSILIVTGPGMPPTDVGEAWHLLDQRYGIPCTLMASDRLRNANLSQYNVIILADGSPGSLPSEKIRGFVQDGGTVVATGSALQWLSNRGLTNLKFRNASSPYSRNTRRVYAQRNEDAGALRLPGSIFEASLDLSHPICYGYQRTQLPIFLSDTIFIETAENPYATPAVFTEAPLLAGYIHPGHKQLVGGSAAIVACGIGSGRIICFAGNPNFRGFWYGTNRMFANAVFFGNLIGWNAVEK
ncbi:MAG: M14 family zinc carboxypeptidase [Saprospiraceae bacterium]